MFRRALTSIFLLTLLFAQADLGLCRLRCDHHAFSQTSSCHSMAMLDESPFAHAEAPCPTPICPVGHALPVTAQAVRSELSTLYPHQPFAVASSVDRTQIASTIDSPPGLARVGHPRSPALPRLTSLRV